MAEGEVQEAVDFLVENRGKRPRELPRDALKERMGRVEAAATADGLPSPTILRLAMEVVCVEGYDLQVRRRLLYCLVPQDEEFPLQVVPLAVSSATVKNASPVWQMAVLAWLSGLLEYGIIIGTDSLPHICYTSVFNMTAVLCLCPLACRVLYHMTVREDVTPNRIHTLARLLQKPAYHTPVAALIRLYHLFRPDLMVARLSDRGLVTHLAPALKARLLNARQRLQDNPTQPLSTVYGDRVWLDGCGKVEKVNVYQRNSAIGRPHINTYMTTVEELKEKIIYTTQYQRFQDMVRGLDQWDAWVWPTNTSAHLACPIVLPLFRPHHHHLQVHVTNWLEVALRTEVVDGLGSASKDRCVSLLRATVDLCRTSAMSLPVVNNFLVELMGKWNHRDYFVEIMELLPYITFSSVDTLLETLVQLLSRLLLRASLVQWCRVLQAVTNIACRWVITAHGQAAYPTPEGYRWPQQVDEDRAAVGVWILTERVERFILSGILNHHSHPLVIHHALDYYEKVSHCCETLNVSMTFFPPALVTLVVMTSLDLAATHRLAQIMVRAKRRMEQLTHLREQGVEEELLEECLYRTYVINDAISLFLSWVYMGKALTPRWRAKLEPFYPWASLKEQLRGRDGPRVTSVTHNLAYLPLVCTRLTHTKGTWTPSQFEEAMAEVLAELRELGLNGVEECWKTYKRGGRKEGVKEGRGAEDKEEYRK